jgi:DHA3 family macrolide efflux protein-like MFS transporter
MLAGGLTLGVWGGFRRRMLTVLAGLSCAGLSIALMGVLPGSAFSAAVGVVFVTGFMLAVTNGPVFAVLQANVAPEMQGRVFALIGSLSAAMAPLGLLVAGPVADALGIGFWYVTAGSAMLVTGLLSYFIPAVVHLEDRRPQAEPARAELEPVPVSVDY